LCFLLCISNFIAESRFFSFKPVHVWAPMLFPSICGSLCPFLFLDWASRFIRIACLSSVIEGDGFHFCIQDSSDELCIVVSPFLGSPPVSFSYPLFEVLDLARATLTAHGPRPSPFFAVAHRSSPLEPHPPRRAAALLPHDTFPPLSQTRAPPSLLPVPFIPFCPASFPFLAIGFHRLHRVPYCFLVFRLGLSALTIISSFFGLMQPFGAAPDLFLPPYEFRRGNSSPPSGSRAPPYLFFSFSLFFF